MPVRHAIVMLGLGMLLAVVIVVMAVLAFLPDDADAGMLGGTGQLMIPGQLQANPVLAAHIVTETGVTIITEAGNPLRTETP